jgi:DNA polymerase-1
MSKPRLFLIDANSFCYRAYFAIKELSTSYGQPTNAIYGFVNMVRKILEKENPDYIAVCFDVSKDTFRTKKFADYKIQRPSMPDGLTSQIPLIKEIISAYNLPIFELEGYEADDIIATIAKRAQERQMEVVVISSDKDILQLVDTNIKVYSPQKSEDKIYDREAVVKRFKLEPEKIVDLIALMGDKTDNIPGVSGIGETTAVKLLQEFRDLDHIYKNLEKIKSEKLRQTLEARKKEAQLSRELAVLRQDVPLKINLDDLKVVEPNYERLFEIFKSLEFKSLLRDLPQKQFQTKPIKIIYTDKRDDLDRLHKELTRRGQEFSFVISPDRIENTSAGIKEVLFCCRKGEIIKIRDIKTIKSILENPDTKKITHNLKRILTNLWDQGIDIKGHVFDIMIAAYLLDSSRANYLIDELALQYISEPIDINDAGAQNTEVIFRLKSILEDKLNDKSLADLFYEVEIPLIFVLAKMELVGVKIDKQFLKDLSADLEKRMVGLIKEIYRISQAEFNINSPKQLRVVLFDKLRLPVIKRTKTGPSTDEEVLRRLCAKHELPRLILEYRQLAKLKSTYIDALPKLVNPKTGKIHTYFDQTGTETGRLSSSDPNLQNLPIKTELGSKIRRAVIVSNPDNMLLSADYSQIELRVLAHLSGDENLNSAFQSGDDIHRFTASLIYEKPQNEVTDAMRDVAKRVNFGIIYGMSSYGLSKDLGISQEEAEGFICAYFLRYPKVKDFMQAQIAKARKDGFVVTLLGRRRYIPQINSKNSSVRQFAERQAINTPVQGSAADLIKLAMINIQKEIERKDLDSKLILQVHDELVFEAPSRELDVVKDIIKRIMEGVIELSVPILVSIKIGKNWLDMEEK